MATSQTCSESELPPIRRLPSGLKLSCAGTLFGEATAGFSRQVVVSQSRNAERPRIVLRSPAARSEPSGLKAMPPKPTYSPLTSRSNLPVCVSQTFSPPLFVRSPPPQAARSFPFGLKASRGASPMPFPSVRTSRPETASRSRTRPWTSALARSLPSGS